MARDNGGPFNEAKLVDIVAMVIYALQEVDSSSVDSPAKQAYDAADELIAEKRRREQTKEP